MNKRERILSERLKWKLWYRGKTGRMFENHSSNCAKSCRISVSFELILRISINIIQNVIKIHFQFS